MNQNQSTTPPDGKAKGEIPSYLKSILQPFMKIDYSMMIILAVGLLLAIAVRASLVNFQSLDFYKITIEWYNTIKEQGFRAFQYGFYDYNPPYLYLLYLLIRFFPDLSAIIITKLPSIFSDFVCAWFVFKIVRLKFMGGPLPIFASFALLFAPTVILNSAAWGQTDSLYTTALVACIYFLIKKQNILAFLAFGVSFAFKLQAIFLFPLLMALFFKKEVSWKYFLLIPLIMALALIPAWIAGRPLSELLTIYLAQANEYGGNAELSLNAPTLYTWLPQAHPIFNLLYSAGLILAVCVVFLFIAVIYETKTRILPSHLIELSLAILLLMPYFLPKMHDRYFFPADVVSIIYAFYFPEYFFIPLSVGIISFFAYQPFLFGQEPIPMSTLALAMFVTICIVMRNAIFNLYFSETSPDKTE